MSNFTIRLVVGIQGGPCSTVWRVWSNKNDVYAAHRNHAGIDKFSFHHSGVCQRALTSKYANEANLKDRASTRWQRATHRQGDKTLRRVLEVVFPTIYLSTHREVLEDKPMEWIAPAPQGQTTFLEMFFTSAAKETLQELFPPRSLRKVVTYSPLPSGEAFVMTAAHADWDVPNVVIPASMHEPKDIIACTRDPFGTGRPLRLTIHSSKSDEGAMSCYELGAFTGQWNDPAFTGVDWYTLSRGRVVALSEHYGSRPWY